MLRARTEVRDGVHTPDSASATVADAADLWLKRGAANGLERGSLRTYGQYVRLAIVPLIGPTRLSRLTRPMVEEFRDDLLQRFAYRRARVILSAWRMILSHAQGRGLVAQNVARDVRIDDRPREITTTFDIYGHLFPEPGDRKERLAVLENFVLSKGAPGA